MKIRASWLAWVLAICTWAACIAESYRAGGGLQYSLNTGDMKNGFGVYINGDYDYNDWLMFRGNIGYLGGKFEDSDLPNSDYTRINLEAAILFKKELKDYIPEYTPYIGFGGGYYFNDLENDLQIDDKLGVFISGGTLIPIHDNYTIDANLRYLWLRPDGPEFVKIEMDALELHVGFNWRF